MTAVLRRLPAQEFIIGFAFILTAAFVALVAADDEERSGRLSGDLLFLSLVLTAIGCVALVWRRRFPVAVALLLVPILAVTDLVGGAVVIALGTAAALRRWPVVIGLSGLYALAHLLLSVRSPDPTMGVSAANALNVALLVLAVAVGRVVHGRRETLASLRERAALAQAESAARSDRLRAQERERIAGEMHDALSHRMSLVSLHAGALEIRSDLSTEEVARAAGTIRASAHQALQDLREILDVLRGDANTEHLRPQPGLSGLDTLLAECRSTGMRVRLDDRLPPALPPPPGASRCAYRVVQEGLTNARKHAPGAEARLILERTDRELHVWLHNGLSTMERLGIPGARSGLVGLDERVRLAGGRLDRGIRRDTAGEVAFHLEVWLPWPT